MLIKSYTLTGEIIVLKEIREGGRRKTLIPALPAPIPDQQSCRDV